MSQQAAFMALRKILAKLYPEDEDARIVVSDAGLVSSRIKFSGVAINTWDSILREAENANQMHQVCDVALQAYGTNSELHQACETYLQYLKPVSSPLPPVLTQTSVAKSGVMKILFLAANPTDQTRLRLEQEHREIDQSLQQSQYRDKFELKHHGAVRSTDLSRLLMRHQPTIVHFSGHGDARGEIILEDNDGNSHFVSPDALSKIFFLLKDNIRCIVLNACFSEKQAHAIAQHIDCVVGMTTAIGDEAAIKFAAAFYQALGFGRNVKNAFDLGCAELAISNIPEEKTPQLIATLTNPSELVLTSSTP